MPDNLAPAGSYTLVGNLPCNTAPVAALSANPISGDPPLLVTFNASASTDPDSGDTIASYTFDFGDGSAPVMQASAIISHTYQSNGHFHATVRVTDNHGLASSNVAGVEIEVELPLEDIVSRKLHGADLTPRDVDLLKPNGTGDVECRTATNYPHTIIYTFDSAFTVTAAASNIVISPAGGANVSSHGPGPGLNQYTVQLSNVANAQHLFVTLNGVPVHNNTLNANATLNNVLARMDVLIGDVNGVAGVTGSDVNLCKAQVGMPVSTSNFRDDINASGEITGSDVNLIKAQVGTGLP
jgi:PKD repeat protein